MPVSEDQLLPFQRRVVDEMNELSKKLEKLNEFIGDNAIFAGLPYDEQIRLRKQREVMIQYRGILVDRIAHFTA